MNTLDRLARWVLDSETTALRRWAEDHQAKARRKAARKAPRRRVEAAERAREGEEWGAIVRKVMLRPGFECELGRHSVLTSGVDPHHLEGGSGKRRQGQSERNVIRACRECHDAYHMNPRAFVDTVKAWCAAWGYPLPNRKEYRHPTL